MATRGLSLFIIVALLSLSSGCAAPKATTENPPAATPAAQVEGNLAQVMRSILFPNSNVIFAAQDEKNVNVKPAPDPALATDPLASSYGGWQAVQNSGIAL